VRIVARVEEVAAPPSDGVPCELDGVSVDALPFYLGPLGFVRSYRALADRLARAMSYDGAVIFRVPSQIATTAVRFLRRSGKPFGLEVVGNPQDVFAPGAVRHPLAPLFRWHFTRQLGRQCRQAAAVAYVTEKTLQRTFPPADDGFTTHYSSIRLPQEWLRSSPRSYAAPVVRARIVCIGSMSTHYKGQDVLLHAVDRCRAAGVDLQVDLVGDGACRAELERLAVELGLDDRVTFAGQLAHGAAILERLDRADLCVIPSRTEGLPRVAIEAMARGLPCVGSRVGGIPELLDEEELVPVGDPVSLAERMCDLLRDPERLATLSARNLAKAGAYVDPVLDARRRAFYGVVRDRTRDWERGRADGDPRRS
jgi:glycosyltransferase involved in cell wall biosynthesis